MTVVIDEHADAGEHDISSMALALSGGGFRATLFELGILLYLVAIDELKNVRSLISVSGGSILAAHLAIQWDQATASPESFIQASASLIRFLRRDIRNRAIARWIWTHAPLFVLLLIAGYALSVSWCVTLLVSFALTWKCPPYTTYFLRRQYKEHFGNTRLGNLTSRVGAPWFAFVATDIKRRQRVAFMKTGIRRFDLAGDEINKKAIPAEGVDLSLAVAASSCFPPIFKSLHLTYKKLSVTYAEFDEAMDLSDGGVSGNLGIEVMISLINIGFLDAARLLICDAERPLTDEPSASSLQAMSVQGAALSAAALTRLPSLKSKPQILQFATRPSGSLALPFAVLTNLFSYRTDLDCPSWYECEALLTHGAAVCQQMFANDGTVPNPRQIKDNIEQTLKAAGSKKETPELTDTLLEKCGRGSKWKLVAHIISALVVWVFIYAAASEIASRFIIQSWKTRPLTTAWHVIFPEIVSSKSIDEIASEVAAAICDGDLKTLETKFPQDALYSLDFTPEPDSSSSVLYYHKSTHSEKCDTDIRCAFTFRGKFAKSALSSGGKVTVVGRLERISTPGKPNAYVVFSEAYIK